MMYRIQYHTISRANFAAKYFDISLWNTLVMGLLEW